MARIAIIGAGLAGLTLAHHLRERHELVVFEKSRGVSGRMATRYADPYRFDHGAQFFTARSKRFREFLAPLVDAGVLGIWQARFVELTGDAITARRAWDEEHPHYVGVPGMNAVPKYLSRGVDVRVKTRIDAVERKGDHWFLSSASDEAFGPFDWLVCTQPAAQTAALEGVSGELSALAGSRTMKACFALMLGFGENIVTGFDAARVLQADISWISRNASKPGRGPACTVVVHATNKWADENIDIDLHNAETHMLSELRRVSGIDGEPAAVRLLHRWLYANADKQTGPGFFIDRNARLAACGDWFIRGRVEAAFQSAVSLADELSDQ